MSNKLDLLAELESQGEEIEHAYDERRKALIPAEVQAALDLVDADYEAKRAENSARREALKDQIILDVLAGGETVKGRFIMAVWNKGRVTWDNKKLDGMMALVPGLSAARSEGKPSVTFRHI